MPYLIKPPVHSINSCNPLFTYTLTNSTPFELRKLKDLQDWGWEVSVHFHDDRDYLDAIRETDKAIKKRRRRTQMLYGDLVGDGPRLTLEEVYEREATKNTAQGLYETKEREGEVGDEASIMSRMTQQRDWVCWADEEADLEADKPNVIHAVDKQSCLPPTLNSEDCRDTASHLYHMRAGSPSIILHTYNASHFIEEDETNGHAPVPRYFNQHADLQPAGREVSSSSVSSTPSNSSTDPGHLLDPYILAMATCGYWCPPIFLQAWSQQNPQSQSAALSTKLPSQDSKAPLKLRKKTVHHNSESGVGNWLQPRFVRPLYWVKEMQSKREGGSAYAIAPGQQQIEDFGDVQRSFNVSSQRNSFGSPQVGRATTISESSFGPFQITTPAHSNPSLGLQPYNSTPLRSGLRNSSPTPSIVSSLFFPGREITQEEYSQRTNRPRKNLQPRQLTPPPGLEAEKDPYGWQAWDRGRARQQNKTDRLLGKDRMFKSSPKNASRDSGRNSWYDDFQKKMKEEQAKLEKEQKQAEKKRKKEEKILEKEERKRKENEAREILRQQGMFAGGYLARYM